MDGCFHEWVGMSRGIFWVGGGRWTFFLWISVGRWVRLVVYFGLVEVWGLFLWLGGGRLGWVEICFLDIFDGWVG